MEGKLFLTSLLLLSVATSKGATAVRIDVEPSQTLTSVGQNMTLLCRAGVPIQYCRMYVPGRPKALNLNPDYRGTSEYVYFGAGLNAGECGMRITTVRDAHNGVFTCSIGVPSSDDEFSANMTVTVTRKPRAPELIVSPPGPLREGDRLVASCTVREGRPAPRLLWFLGTEPLTEGMSPPLTLHSAEDLITVTQNVTRAVTWRDHMRELKCAVQHPALQERDVNQTTRQLTVEFKPRNTDVSEQFGFTVGHTGTVRQQVYANPRPRFEWSVVPDEWIEEDQTDSTGRFKAQPGIKNGTGVWEAHLIIEGVTMEDVARVYKLRARNTLGTTEYTVSISTAEKSEGSLELSNAAIIGIAVAILLVLLIIVLLIFARATGRWCFAGGVPTRHDNRESDTESADHGPLDGGQKPKMSLGYIFSKKKDKVAADISQLKDVTVDDEKMPPQDLSAEGVTAPANQRGPDVVYAELDLQATRRPMVRREDERTEYAEIIHTKPGQDKK